MTREPQCNGEEDEGREWGGGRGEGLLPWLHIQGQSADVDHMSAERAVSVGLCYQKEAGWSLGVACYLGNRNSGEHSMEQCHMPITHPSVLHAQCHPERRPFQI